MNLRRISVAAPPALLWLGAALAACSSSPGAPDAGLEASSGTSPGTAGAPSVAGSNALPAGSGSLADGGSGGGGNSAGAGGSQVGIAGVGSGGVGGAGLPSTAGSPSGGAASTDPGPEGDGKRTLAKPFTASPDVSAQNGVPHGARLKFVMLKGSTERYSDANDREINVYVPSQYVKGTPASVLVVQDGNQFFGWVDLVSNTLDNLIGQNKLPPIVAVFVNNGGGDAQGSHRGQEYDTLSGVYAEFVDREVLPRVEQETSSKLPDQAVTFSKDPEARGTLGGSSGGIASFIAAWYHPDLFRRVIGFSPSFVAQESPKNPDHPLGAWNFHEDGHEDDGGIIAKTDPLKPIRVWMEAGTNDNGAGTQNDPNTPYPYYDFAYAIPRAFDKMLEKSYPHVHLDVGTGAGHVDGGMVRATLPDALLWTWRGSPGWPG